MIRLECVSGECKHWWLANDMAAKVCVRRVSKKDLETDWMNKIVDDDSIWCETKLYIRSMRRKCVSALNPFHFDAPTLEPIVGGVEISSARINVTGGRMVQRMKNDFVYFGSWANIITFKRFSGAVSVWCEIDTILVFVPKRSVGNEEANGRDILQWAHCWVAIETIHEMAWNGPARGHGHGMVILYRPAL